MEGRRWGTTSDGVRDTLPHEAASPQESSSSQDPETPQDSSSPQETSSSQDPETPQDSSSPQDSTSSQESSPSSEQAQSRRNKGKQPATVVNISPVPGPSSPSPIGNARRSGSGDSCSGLFPESTPPILVAPSPAGGVVAGSVRESPNSSIHDLRGGPRRVTFEVGPESLPDAQPDTPPKPSPQFFSRSARTRSRSTSEPSADNSGGNPASDSADQPENAATESTEDDIFDMSPPP